MNGFNKVILAGNLTRDPELRYTPSGTAIAKFGLAINRKWRDSNSGELRDEVTFIDVDAFGKQAETIGQYMKKGSAILVEGRLKLDQWEDKQTQQKRSRLGVVAESFNFLGSGQSREGGGGDFNSGTSAPAMRSRPPQAAPAASSAASPSEPDSLPPEEDDVPF
jgi:single-strand DNA-binding protein